MKYYNVMISWQNVFNQPVKKYLRTYNVIQKIASGQGNDYATGCLLDNIYTLDLVDADLSKQEALDADPEAVQKISFTRNLNDTNANIVFIVEEAKETILDLYWRYCKFILLEYKKWLSITL